MGVRVALSFVLAATLATTSTGAARADEALPSGDFALSGCRVVTAVGDEIADGVVVVKDGKITAVGKSADVKIGRGIRVVKASGKVVTPAFVHVATRLGLEVQCDGLLGTVQPDEVA